MAENAYTMSNRDAEEHLKAGGAFEAMDGELRFVHVPSLDRYVLANDTGNGMDYVQPRYATIQDLMEQLGGGLAAWEAVGPPDGG